MSEDSINSKAIKIINTNKRVSRKIVNEIALIPNGFTILTTKEYKSLIKIIPSNTVMFPNFFTSEGSSISKKNNSRSILNSIFGNVKVNIISGVYIFCNTITSEIYVGSSKNLRRRIVNYTIDTKSIYKKSYRKVIISIKQYGLENFSVHAYVINPLLEKGQDPTRFILALEQYIIFKINPQLNIIKAVNAYTSIGNKIIGFYKTVDDIKVNVSSVTCYVYVNNIIVYKAYSVISLSKVLCISVNRVFANIRQSKLI